MFQTISQRRVNTQILLAVAAALLAVSVYVALQLAAAGSQRIAPFQGQPQIQVQHRAPANPVIDYNSTHIREWRGGVPF